MTEEERGRQGGWLVERKKSGSTSRFKKKITLLSCFQVGRNLDHDEKVWGKNPVDLGKVKSERTVEERRWVTTQRILQEPVFSSLIFPLKENKSRMNS